MRAAELTLNGWGKTTPLRTRAYRPDRRRLLLETLADASESSWIARGLGRSYGDSAINPTGATLLCEQVDHMLDFDDSRGVVTCEAGVSFADLVNTFLPRGWFLPVTPGTKFVTVGGAIAADVHGKNHHVDGTFGRHVESIELLLANHQIIMCSEKENSDIFGATLGGMGLTGTILSARFRMMPVESAYVTVDVERARNLDHALELFERGDATYRYSVAWVDCLATGDTLGRSVLMRGNHMALSELPASARAHPLSPPRRWRKSVPFDMPGFVLNAWSVRAFNELYYRGHKDGRCVVDFERYFYPLDAICHWNRLYGRRGFVQYQALFPRDSAREGMRSLLRTISESRLASFLAVLKRTGESNAGLLSFPQPGYTLALDLPRRGERLRALLPRLDGIVLEHGGRLYLAKDASMSAEAFARMYPRLDEFRALQRRLDPEGRWSSAQARRLGIVEAP